MCINFLSLLSLPSFKSPLLLFFSFLLISFSLIFSCLFIISVVLWYKYWLLSFKFLKFVLKCFLVSSICLFLVWFKLVNVIILLLVLVLIIFFSLKEFCLRLTRECEFLLENFLLFWIKHIFFGNFLSIFLQAYTSPVALFWIRKTFPYDPCPNSFMNS